MGHNAVYQIPWIEIETRGKDEESRERPDGLSYHKSMGDAKAYYEQWRTDFLRITNRGTDWCIVTQPRLNPFDGPLPMVAVDDELYQRVQEEGTVRAALA